VRRKSRFVRSCMSGGSVPHSADLHGSYRSSGLNRMLWVWQNSTSLSPMASVVLLTAYRVLEKHQTRRVRRNGLRQTDLASFQHVSIANCWDFSRCQVKENQADANDVTKLCMRSRCWLTHNVKVYRQRGKCSKSISDCEYLHTNIWVSVSVPPTERHLSCSENIIVSVS
jgi:hypothetical protein